VCWYSFGEWGESVEEEGMGKVWSLGEDIEKVSGSIQSKSGYRTLL
jgi:hypothetical protein